MQILLIGAGQISHEYVKALRALGHNDITVLSKSSQSAKIFAEKVGLGQSYGGGEETCKEIAKDFNAIIIASSMSNLLPLLEVCATTAPNVKVLAEKPVALESKLLKEFLSRNSGYNNAKVALNRLYFPSVQKLREILSSEPATSSDFSFTEWVHRIDEEHFSSDELDKWGAGNCIHVTSTVFDLIGLPAHLSGFVSGKHKLNWHPEGTIYTGAGKSDSGVLFSYHSDWGSAGRWQIGVNTEKGRYDLCPMEGLQFTPKGTVRSETIVETYAGETKCGFVPMIDSWLNERENTVSLQSMVQHLQVVEQIFQYK